MRPKTGTPVWRPDLGDWVYEFMEGDSFNFVGPQIMPYYFSPDQAGTYPVIPMEVFLSLEDVARAERGAYNRGDWEYEAGVFATREKGWEEPMDDREFARLEARSPGLADEVATMRAMKIIMRAQEKRIADTVFNDTNFTAHSITEEWDDATNAVPINDVKDGVAAFRLQAGMEPDALVIAYSTFLNLQECSQIRTQLAYTFPGIDIANLTAEQIARVLGVPRLIVGGSIYNSAGKGLTGVKASIWSNEYAALVKISNSQDITDPCVGRTIVWTGDSPQNPTVETYREEAIRSDVYRVRHDTAETLIQSKDTTDTVVSDISASCMYLFDNVTT